MVRRCFAKTASRVVPSLAAKPSDTPHSQTAPPSDSLRSHFARAPSSPQVGQLRSEPRTAMAVTIAGMLMSPWQGEMIPMMVLMLMLRLLRESAMAQTPPDGVTRQMAGGRPQLAEVRLLARLVPSGAHLAKLSMHVHCEPSDSRSSRAKPPKLCRVVRCLLKRMYLEQ